MSAAETALLILLSGMVEEQEEATIAEAGETEEIAQYQFITADETACDECRPFNGDIFDELEINDLFDYEVVTEEVLRANIHINCRCQLLRITAPTETIFPELM